MTGLLFHVLVREWANKAFVLFCDAESFLHRVITPNVYKMHSGFSKDKYNEPGRIECLVDKWYHAVVGKIERKLFMGLVILGR